MSSTVLITGANRGLGLEFVRQYAAAGWRVVATCRNPGAADALAALPVEVAALDVADLAGLPAAVARLGQGPLDLVINNAGVFGGSYADQELSHVTPAHWDEVLRVNTIAPLMLTTALLPRLPGPGPGAGAGARAVFLSSQLGSMADNTSGGLYLYRSSKAALNAVVKSLAIDLAPRGITVAALHPGWVRTDMGGPQAPLDAPTSVAGMRAVIDGLTPADSGRFLAYDGKEVPW